MLAQAETGEVFPFLTSRWKRRAFFEAREKGPPSLLCDLLLVSGRKHCVLSYEILLCGYFGAVSTTHCNYLGHFKNNSQKQRHKLNLGHHSTAHHARDK